MMELHALVQLHPPGPPIGAQRPAIRQPGLVLARLRVDLHEPLEHGIVLNVVIGRPVDPGAHVIQVRRDEPHHQAVHLGLPRRGVCADRRGGHQEQDWQQQDVAQRGNLPETFSIHGLTPRFPSVGDVEGHSRRRPLRPERGRATAPNGASPVARRQGPCDTVVIRPQPQAPGAPPHFPAAARGEEQAPADDERQPAHRGHEDPRILLAQEAARERAEEHRGVDADAVQAHPPRQVLGARVLADHADRQHPAREAEPEARAARHEPRERPQADRGRAQPEHHDDEAEDGRAPQAVGEPPHGQQRDEVHELREHEQARDATPVQAELARPPERQEELADRGPRQGEDDAHREHRPQRDRHPIPAARVRCPRRARLRRPRGVGEAPADARHRGEDQEQRRRGDQQREAPAPVAGEQPDEAEPAEDADHRGELEDVQAHGGPGPSVVEQQRDEPTHGAEGVREAQDQPPEHQHGERRGCSQQHGAGEHERGRRAECGAEVAAGQPAGGDRGGHAGEAQRPGHDAELPVGQRAGAADLGQQRAEGAHREAAAEADEAEQRGAAQGENGHRSEISPAGSSPTRRTRPGP